MKNYIYVIIICLLANIGCSDFLKEESENSFTANALLETPEGLEKMVMALYPYERGIAQKGNANSFLAAYLWGERSTDLVLFTTGDDANLGRYTSPGPSSNIKDLLYSPFWKHRYYIIGRANEIITYGEPMGKDAERSVAEASFWRAYSYYNLWSKFSKVLLITEPTTENNFDKIKYAPADSAKVFDLMYADTKKAIKGLPLKNENINDGRITKATARHMLALIAAWAKDWHTVIKQVDSIDIEGSVKLIPDPADIFSRSNLYNTSETLFALHYSQDRGGGKGHRIGSQAINVISESNYTFKMVNGQLVQYNEENLGRQWALALPNSYLLSKYGKNDKRLKAFYKTHYTYQNPNSLITIPPASLVTDPKTGIQYYNSTNMTSSPVKIAVGDTIFGRDIYAATKKKLDRRQILPSSIKMYDSWDKPINADGPYASFKDVIIYRLAESYLLAAEAYYHLGNQEKAREYYNKTWERAGNAKETGTITFQMIMDEQARELAFEGRRWDFLKRNGIWYKQMRNYSGDFTKYPGSSSPYDSSTYGVSDGRDASFGPNPDFYIDFNGSDNDILVRFNVKPEHVNWPIPQDQIDIMGASNFPQNPGY